MYLCSSITRECVVPQTLVRASNRLLLVVVIAMAVSDGCQRGEGCEELLRHFDTLVRLFKRLYLDGEKQKSVQEARSPYRSSMLQLCR